MLGSERAGGFHPYTRWRASWIRPSRFQVLSCPLAIPLSTSSRLSTGRLRRMQICPRSHGACLSTALAAGLTVKPTPIMFGVCAGPARSITTELGELGRRGTHLSQETPPDAADPLDAS